MVNKKVTPTSPAPAAVPQRKAARPATSAKPPAASNGQATKAPTPQRAATTPRPSAAATRLEGVQKGFRETVAELKKVQWPDRMTTRNLTLVVIGMSTVLAAILGLLDAGLTWVIEWLVRL
jgi:preprotein translocase subunit SecE